MGNDAGTRWGLFKKEARAYVNQVRGLWPGIEVPSLFAHQVRPGDLDHWHDDDRDLLIEHARQQLDRQRADIELVRQRSQFLFSTCLGALGLFGLAAGQVTSSMGAFIVAGLAVALVAFSLLGAAGIVVARKGLRMVDTVILTTFDPPIRPVLAAGLAASISDGENTVATLITVYRDAVLLLILGVAVFGGVWIATL